MKHPAELPEVDPVRLKPFLGMQPGLYLLILYVVAIVLILFLVGFLPGIMNGGRYVTFHGTLSGSGIYLDGSYLGSADYQYFVKSGTHSLTVRKADVVVTDEKISIDHPVFFTWLVHRTKQLELPITASLTEEEKRAIIRFDVNEIVRYSAITDYNSVTVYPPLFANLSKDMKALEMPDEIYGLAGAYISGKEMYRDALQVVTDDVLFAQELNAAKALFGEGVSQSFGTGKEPVTVTGKRTTLKAENFTQDGIMYPETVFVMGDGSKDAYPDTNTAGIRVTTRAFTIATTPVTQQQWAQFIEENPSWAKSNIAALQKEGLVDQNYLAGLSPTVRFSPTGRPVYNVSYKAAQAFCAWLSAKTGKRVFLPSEAQWSLAAAGVTEYQRTLTLDDDGATTPSAMLGGVWELTGSRYIPLARLCGYERICVLADAWALNGDVIVKGGSYQNDGITVDSIGAVTQEACGDLIGLRIAWTEQ